MKEQRHEERGIDIGHLESTLRNRNRKNLRATIITKALEEFDRDKDGVITDEELADIIADNLDDKKSIKTLHKVVGVGLIFLLLSLASNFGLTWVVVSKNQKTTTNDSNELVAKGTGEIVSTKAQGGGGYTVSTFELHTTASRRSLLQEILVNDTGLLAVDVNASLGQVAKAEVVQAADLLRKSNAAIRVEYVWYEVIRNLLVEASSLVIEHLSSSQTTKYLKIFVGTPPLSTLNEVSVTCTADSDTCLVFKVSTAATTVISTPAPISPSPSSPPSPALPAATFPPSSLMTSAPSNSSPSSSSNITASASDVQTNTSFTTPAASNVSELTTSPAPLAVTTSSQTTSSPLGGRRKRQLDGTTLPANQMFQGTYCFNAFFSSFTASLFVNGTISNGGIDCNTATTCLPTQTHAFCNDGGCFECSNDRDCQNQYGNSSFCRPCLLNNSRYAPSTCQSQAKVTTGYACNSNSDCQSNICQPASNAWEVSFCSDCSVDADCHSPGTFCIPQVTDPHAFFTVSAFSKCQSKLMAGSLCVNNADQSCALGLYCKYQTVNHGTCQAQQDLGTSCSRNATCLSGNCQSGKCVQTPPTVCYSVTTNTSSITSLS